MNIIIPSIDYYNDGKLSIEEMIFPNLKILVLKHLHGDYFKLISKLKLPKLEQVNSKCPFQYSSNYQNHFFKQIQNINIFDCDWFTPSKDICLLKNLMELIINLLYFDGYDDIKELNQEFFF